MEENVLASNDALAQYMGIGTRQTRIGKDNPYFYVYSVPPGHPLSNRINGVNVDSTVFQFHNDWNWLMAVLDKIQADGYTYQLDCSKNPGSTREDGIYYWCEIGFKQWWAGSQESLLDAVYKAVTNYVLQIKQP